jgi:hypothetical protein
MVAEWGKPINSPSVEESGMLPSNTAPQPGNIEARKTISGIPEHPESTPSFIRLFMGYSSDSTDATVSMHVCTILHTSSDPGLDAAV